MTASTTLTLNLQSLRFMTPPPFPKPAWSEVTYFDADGVSHTLPSIEAMEKLWASCSVKRPRSSWNDSQNKVEDVLKTDTKNYERNVREWFASLGIKFVGSSTKDWEPPWVQVEVHGDVFNIEDLVDPNPS